MALSLDFPEIKRFPLRAGSFRIRIMKPRRLGPVAPSVRNAAWTILPYPSVIEHQAAVAITRVTASPVAPDYSGSKEVSVISVRDPKTLDPALSFRILEFSFLSRGEVSPTSQATPGSGGISGQECMIHSIDFSSKFPAVGDIDPGFPSIGKARDGIYVVSGLPVILRSISRERLPARIADAIDRDIPLRSGFELHEVEVVAIFTDIPINRVMKLEMAEDFKSLQVHPSPRARNRDERQTLVFFRDLEAGEIHRIFV